MPEELFEWIVEKAARDAIVRKKKVSTNALTVEILMKAMRADRKKSG
jgi:hypothetical protein